MEAIGLMKNNILQDKQGTAWRIEYFIGLNDVHVDIALLNFPTDDAHDKSLVDLSPVPLTEVWLERLGFDWVENESYCNGKQWTLQVSKKYEGETEINKDGTWFDGIGDYSWMPGSTKPKTMVVSTVCRGNYVCNSVQYVHQLQNLYFALTGEELTINRR